jgi:DNA-binding transcriptional ArsR family regulator
MIEVDLDETAKGILMATLASPKTAGELTRIFGLPGAVVVDYLELLEHLGLVRVVLSYFGRDGRIIRYYEADLPIDTSDLARKEPAAP